MKVVGAGTAWAGGGFGRALICAGLRLVLVRAARVTGTAQRPSDVDLGSGEAVVDIAQPDRPLTISLDTQCRGKSRPHIKTASICAGGLGIAAVLGEPGSAGAPAGSSPVVGGSSRRRR